MQPVCRADDSGQQGQCIHVPRPDHGEVAASDVATSVSPSRSATATTEASVVPSGRLSCVFTKVGHPRKVGARQVDGREVPISEGLQEQRLHAGTGFAG